MEQQNDAKTLGNDLELKSVLIARFEAMGNVVMTIPVVYSACMCYPSVNFIMLTSRPFTGLFINKPSNLTLVGVDMHSHEMGLKGKITLLNNLISEYSIDAFIDLQHDSSTKILRWMCRLKGIKTVTFNRAMRNKRVLTRKTNKVMLPLVSSRARYRETFFKAGLTIEEYFECLFGTGMKAEPRLYANITTDTKTKGQKWIGIAPFAAHPEKEYPTAKMEEVMRMITEMGDVRIFIFGGKGREKAIAEAWAQKYPQVTSLAGQRYGFESELALLSNLDAIITMDSANMHLASIVGTPTVSVWGATHHYCGFKGWHQSENDMVQVPLSCRPCSVKGDRGCYRHDLLCLTAIRPEMIYKKLVEKLQRNTDQS